MTNLVTGFYVVVPSREERVNDSGRSIKMHKFRVQDLLEIRKELGLSVGPTRRKKEICELIEADEVSREEAQEAHEAILKR